MGRLKWGLIGGGKGSQIGDAHRIATSLDRDFEFTAAAIDIDPEKGKGFFCAFGNIYLDIGANLRAKKSGEAPPPLARNFPTAEEALQDMKAIEAAANSAKSGGSWITL